MPTSGRAWILLEIKVRKPPENAVRHRHTSARGVGALFIMFLFFAASTMNLLYLHIPENHISDIALSRGYLLTP